MTEHAKFLLVPALIAAGWLIYQSSSIWGWRIWYCQFVAAGALFAVVTVSGALHRHESFGTAHRWMGHSLVILLWLAIPTAIGIAAARWIRKQPGFALGQVVLLLGLFGLSLLASMTGYLGPSYGHSNPETLFRFHLLHEIVLPAISIGLLSWLLWVFR